MDLSTPNYLGGTLFACTLLIILALGGSSATVAVLATFAAALGWFSCRMAEGDEAYPLNTIAAGVSKIAAIICGVTAFLLFVINLFG